MKAKVKSKFAGNGTVVHVQHRPGHGKAIALDKATEKELEYLLEMNHPAVIKDEPPKPKQRSDS